ncbi:MAG: O-antigen ligase family protein [Tepidanaerobacteraceae bacterium]|nr:O-antigen ligase family protein [Tepidanaerobacteraceae bacterium]
MKSLQFWVAATCAFLSIIIIPSTMSRSAWISIVAVLIIIVCKELGATRVIKRLIQRYRYNTIIGLTLIVAITLSLFAGMYYMKKDSADGRVLIWKNTISLIKEKPLTGVGFGQFGVAYGNRQSEYFSSEERSLDEVRVAGVPQYAFNDYLQMAAEQGIPSALLFIAFIIFVIISLVKSRSILLYPFLTLLLFSLTSYSLNVLPVAIVFVLITATTHDGSFILINNRKINIVIFSLLMVTGIFVSGRQFINNIDKYRAYKDWSEAQILYNMQYFEEASKDYKKIYVHLKDQEKFLFEYGRSLNQIKEFEESNQILLLGTKISGDPMFYNVIGNNYKSLGLFKEAEASYKRAYYGVPNRLYPLYLLSKLYYDTGQREEFYIYSDKVLNFDPKVVSPATREIKSEIRELTYKFSQENEKEIKK